MGYSVSRTDAYTLQGLRSRLGLDRPFLSDRLRAGLGYQFWLQSFLSVSDAIPGPQASALGMNGIYRLALLDQILTYDGRDDPIEPHLGFFLGAYFEEGATYLGGAFSYAKASPEIRGYLPLGSRLVLAARARFGWAFWTRGEVPITQRYYSGGGSSQRGFAPQRLSPIAGDEQGKRVPIGGQALFESSVELRFEALKLFGNWLNLVAFADGADATMRLSELDLGKLHWAVGGGLRYLTPVGPVRFDVGVRLNRTGPGEPDPNSHYAIHVSLGEAF
jgi:outer membrane protein assembly factor BamA